MLVLAIDTSTPVITAGVVMLKRPSEIAAELAAAGSDAAALLSAANACTVAAERTRVDSFGHAEHLMPLVTEALAESGRAVADLEAVVVGTGPGPFTGLRVGMATAAALGDARGIPVHGVPSHDAIAHAAAWDGDFLVVTDARRKEVYVSGYAESLVRVFGPAAVRPADLAASLTDASFAPAWVTGPGADLLAGHLALPIRAAAGSVSAGLVWQASRALLTGAIPGPLTPLYLRRPDATEPHAPKHVIPTAP